MDFYLLANAKGFTNGSRTPYQTEFTYGSSAAKESVSTKTVSVPEEVHLPSYDATMHERHSCVGLFWYFYTHDYKNGWFGFTKRPNVRACYSKNLDSVKNWNDYFFWVDEFVVPANARFPEEFLCWVGISRNYLLNKDTYPRFEYENEEEMDLNAFIRTADPRKVRIVERARTENERPIVTVAKHRTVTLLPTSVVCSSGELSASVEREFVVDASVGDGGDQGFDSVGGQDNVAPRFRLMVEQGVPLFSTFNPYYFLRDIFTFGGGGDSHDSVNGSFLLRTVGPSARFVVLSNSSHHSATNFAGPEGDSFVRSIILVMTEATAVTTIATTVAIPADVGKDIDCVKGSGFAAGSIRAEEVTDAGLEEIYVPEWTVTKGFELNDGRSCYAI
ncbi:hypothetical protein Tco_1061603 [Tanacetum coccineum]